jgi:uncharacterized protein (TIGR03083 family)
MNVVHMRAALEEQGRRFADAVEHAELDTVVPSCPDWTVRDLARHLGMVHRWATAVVEAAGPAVDDEAFEAATVYPPDEALLGWFRDGHRALVATLERSPEDVPCWTFMGGSPSPLHFWTRRQLHETAVHRMDAELGAGRAPSPIAAEVAADGVDELLTAFIVRPHGRLRSEQPWTMAVVPTDVDNAWTVRVTADPTVTAREAEPADLTLSGRAADLYAFLWNRSRDGVSISGHQDRVQEWRSRVTIGW